MAQKEFVVLSISGSEKKTMGLLACHCGKMTSLRLTIMRFFAPCFHGSSRFINHEEPRENREKKRKTSEKRGKTP